MEAVYPDVLKIEKVKEASLDGTRILQLQVFYSKFWGRNVIFFLMMYRNKAMKFGAFPLISIGRLSSFF